MNSEDKSENNWLQDELSKVSKDHEKEKFNLAQAISEASQNSQQERANFCSGMISYVKGFFSN